MNGPFQRKPRLHFETTQRPDHLTFDDGVAMRRGLSWVHFSEVQWSYEEEDVLRILLGDWKISLRGHNLGPLFEAIQARSLYRIKAQPELDGVGEAANDTFVTEIQFASVALKARGESKTREALLPGM